MDEQKFRELWYDDQLNEVEDDIDDSWRHGNNHNTVYEYNGQYWRASYQVSGDGEYHGIRDEDFTLTRVFPTTTVQTITTYSTKVPPKTSKTAFRRKVYQVEACQFPGLPKVDLETGAVDGDFDALASFQDWIVINQGDMEVKLVGDQLQIGRGHHKTLIPAGMWIVKEPGFDIYPLSDEQFKQTFEAA